MFRGLTPEVSGTLPEYGQHCDAKSALRSENFENDKVVVFRGVFLMYVLLQQSLNHNQPGKEVTGMAGFT